MKHIDFNVYNEVYMEPSKKLTILLIVLFLSFVALNAFLSLKYKAELSEQNKTKTVSETKQQEGETALIPYINTFEIPPARVGAKYQSEVFATVSSTNENLSISIAGLPDGLAIGQCSQEINAKSIPTPNTQTKCVIGGVPVKAGLYRLKLTAANKNNDRSTVAIDLIVTAD